VGAIASETYIISLHLQLLNLQRVGSLDEGHLFVQYISCLECNT